MTDPTSREAMQEQLAELLRQEAKAYREYQQHAVQTEELRQRWQQAYSNWAMQLRELKP